MTTVTRLKWWCVRLAERYWPAARSASAWMEAPVQVETVEFEDASEPGDAHGYYYKGRVYLVSVNGQLLKLRSYSDEPEQVSFLSMNDELFTAKALRHPALKRVQEHFRGLGFKTFKVLYGREGYRDL